MFNAILSLAFLLVSISHSAFAEEPKVSKLFIELVKKPSNKKLVQFKKACVRGSDVNFEGDLDVAGSVEKVVMSGSLIAIRAMVYAESHCSDGASRQSVKIDLGNPILLKHPAKLIKALALETDGRGMTHLVEVESKDWFAVECKDEKCKVERKAYFAEKRKALERAKVSSAHEPIRKALLSHLVSDR